jgi:hypothetical protein
MMMMLLLHGGMFCAPVDLAWASPARELGGPIDWIASGDGTVLEHETRIMTTDPVGPNNPLVVA